MIQPRRRLDAATRRAQIVEVATTMLSEGGYNRFTLSHLAERCELTRAGLSRHFATREDVFVAVLRFRDQQDLSAEGVDELINVASLDDFRRVMRRVVRRNLEQPELVRLYTLLSAEALAESHPAHEYFQQRLTQGCRLLAGILAPWHPEPDRLTIQIVSFLDGLQQNWLRDPSIDVEAHWADFEQLMIGS
ncbi:TetR/AcrR family transcriptional regulator [soil metagenome]